MAIEKKQNIVIVGGGSAGAAIVKRIVPELNPATQTLTLITSRPFFINVPAMLRMAVTAEGTLEEHALMPYTHSLIAADFKADLKIGKVARFTSSDGGQGGGDVILESGESIPYSILVLATGNTWTGPMNYPEVDFRGTQAYLNVWRHKFSLAKDVVLIGGGAVGMELAGEIKDFYPNTHVTLVHRDAELLNASYPKRFRTSALRRLQRTGTRVILDDSLHAVEPSADGTVTTTKGEIIKADMVIPCSGGRPNTALISASLGPHVLTESGHVKIKPTFQVQGYPRIFAAGDIIDWDEQKQAAKAYLAHSPLVTSNILALLNASGPLKSYEGSKEVLVIVTGRSGGVAYVEPFWGIGIILGDFVVRHFKSRGLIIDLIRGWYNLGNYSSEDKELIKV